MQNKEFLDFDETVQFLKTTPSTLYKWLQAGKIPGHKLGRQWRFLKDELEIHVSGKGPRIQTQKDFLLLTELLLTRSKHKESEMNIHSTTISEQIIWDAFDHGSRLVHIYPTKGKYEIAYRSRSRIEKLTDIQEETYAELDHSLHQISSAIDDGSSRRMYLHRGEEDVLQVRYQKLETVAGPRLTLRLYQPESDVLPLEKITGESQVLVQFKEWLTKKNGIILVSGSTGSGKTTTVYSLLNEFKNQGRLVFSIEDSVEMVIEGINQIEIKGHQPENFESIFDQVYSSDPDVICLGLGSIVNREEKIFSLACKAASSGHLVIIQVNKTSCKDALETFARATQQSVKQSIDNLIIGVSCQKLIEENGRVKAVYEFL